MSLFSLVVVLNGDPVDMYIRRYVSVDGVRWGVPVVRELTESVLSSYVYIVAVFTYVHMYVSPLRTVTYVCTSLVRK